MHCTTKQYKTRNAMQWKQDAQLSQRDRAAGSVIVWAKSGRLELEDNIYGHYRSIFNQCDIIGLKICRIRLKTQNKGYYGVQGHSVSSRSVPIKWRLLILILRKITE